MTSKFRFESLLNIRRAEMHEQEAIFHSLQKDVQKAQTHLENCRKDFNNSLESLRLLYTSNTITSNDLHQHLIFHETLSFRLQKAQQTVIDRTHELETQRALFEEKIKEVKTLESLKAKNEQRWNEEVKRKSSIEMDELATHRKTIVTQKRNKGIDSYE